MRSEMVTRESVHNLKVELLKQFEVQIGLLHAKFVELESANSELRARVDALEAKLQTSTAGPDPAFQRLSFLGFESGTDLERIAHISSFMSTHFPGISVFVSNVMRGPRSARVLTKIVYAEFCDADVRNAVLSQVRSRNLSCTFGGKSIKVLPALSKVIRARMWALDRAQELVSRSSFSEGKTVVKVNTRQSHCITLNGEVVFEQKPGLTDLGSFLGSCATLELPASHSRS